MATYVSKNIPSVDEENETLIDIKPTSQLMTFIVDWMIHQIGLVGGERQNFVSQEN